MSARRPVDEIMAEYRRKMQRLADTTGNSMTITAGGASVTFAPRPKVCGRCVHRLDDGSCTEHRHGGGDGNVIVGKTSKACDRGKTRTTTPESGYEQASFEEAAR